MAWELAGGILGGLVGTGGLVGSLVSRQKTVSEAKLTAIQAAETVNTMLVNQVMRLQGDLDKAEINYDDCKLKCEEANSNVRQLTHDLKQEKLDCAKRLREQDEKIAKLEISIRGKQDRTNP